jgi:hypothetical protein
MAERVGFEPTLRVTVNTLSKRSGFLGTFVTFPVFTNFLTSNGSRNGSGCVRFRAFCAKSHAAS